MCTVVPINIGSDCLKVIQNETEKYEVKKEQLEKYELSKLVNEIFSLEYLKNMLQHLNTVHGDNGHSLIVYSDDNDLLKYCKLLSEAVTCLVGRKDFSEKYDEKMVNNARKILMESYLGDYSDV
jgi:hypothetical protein